MTDRTRLLTATLLALVLAPLAAEAQLFPRTPGRNPTGPLFGGSKTEPVLEPTLFPALSGKNLAGEAFRFPEQLAGHVSLVFLVGSPEQEIFLESWMPALHDLLARHEDLQVFVLVLVPKSAQAPEARKGWPWERSSRPALSLEERRTVLIPVFSDRAEVLQALKIEPDEYLHILLINPDKQVEWAGRGARDNGKGDDLAMQVDRVVSDGKRS